VLVDRRQGDIGDLRIQSDHGKTEHRDGQRSPHVAWLDRFVSYCGRRLCRHAAHVRLSIGRFVAG
jgi:hypothetical protein